ncbi:MAG: hypothetical protein EAZ91_03980 [Cytophagales bacterium]|nr:MAG: hypothetical protein EAZ91_03980 [Cytophagales bacterium]
MATVFNSFSKSTKRWLTALIGCLLVVGVGWVVSTRPDWATKHPYLLIKASWKAGKFVLLGLLAFGIKWWTKRTKTGVDETPQPDESTSLPEL